MGKRRVEVEIIGDARSLGRAASDAESKMGKLGGAFKRLAAAGAVFGTAVAVAGFTKSVDAASDLNEQLTKSQAVFGASSGAVRKWSKSAAQSMGMSRRMALEATGTFGNMLVPMGFARKEAAGMSQRMVQLSADMASFNNASPEDTLLAIRSGLAGESEPLRKFGVFLSEARVQQEAVNLGLTDGKKALTEAQKAQARYSLILKDSKDAQGDFARTSDGLANSQRIARARLEDSAATLGKGLLPVAAAAVGKFADLVSWGGTALPQAWQRMKAAGQTAVAWFQSNLMPTIDAAVSHIRAVWRFMGDDIMRVARTAFNAVVGVVRPALQLVVGIVKAVGALIRGDWSALWNAVKQTASGALKTVVAVIRGAASAALAAARFVGTMIWQGVKFGVAKLAQLHAELIRMVGSAIKAAAAWALGAAADIGRAIGQGVLNGVKSMAGAVAGAVQDMASGALSKAKSFLHINSPSRVFSREVGAPITEGIAHGIMSKAPMVSTAIDKLLRKMKGKLSAQSRLSIAELTFGTADDLAALKRVAKVAEKQLRVALRSGKQDKIQEAAGNLKGVRDQLRQLQGDRRDNKLQAAVDMAKLTAGTGDDVKAMRAMERSLVARLAEATKRKDYSGQSQIAQALLGLRGELSSLTTSNTGGDVNVTINPGAGFDASDPRQLAASISWWMRAASVGAVA